jgi:hypothetical protein
MDTSAIASDLPIRQSLPSLRPVPAAVRGDGVAAPGGDDPLAGEHQAAGRRGRKGWTGLGMGPPPDRSAGPWTAAAATPASTAKTTAGDNPVTGPPRWVWSWADAAAFHEISGGLVDDLPPPPAHVPRRLLADPVFVRALQDRDFSVVFAMAHGVGISFNRIAEAWALKSDRVSQITRARARSPRWPPSRESPAVCAFPVPSWALLRNLGRTPPLPARSPTMEMTR